MHFEYTEEKGHQIEPEEVKLVAMGDQRRAKMRDRWRLALKVGQAPGFSSHLLSLGSLCPDSRKRKRVI